MTKNKWLLITLLLLLIGIADSIYLVHHHYWVNILHPDAASFCSINDVLDCDEVALSPYSMIGNFPVATLGVLGYAALFLMLIFSWIFDRNRLKKYLSFSYAMTLLMFLFSLYEASVSIFIIGKICLMCSILYLSVCALLVTHKFAIASPFSDIYRDLKDFLKEAVIYTDRKYLFYGLFSLFIAYFTAVSIDYQFRTEFTKIKLAELAQKKELSASGLNFLEKNKTNDNVTVLPSGLQYQILKPGTGNHPKSDDYVLVHYIGKLTNGFEFNNTYKGNQPAYINLEAVISGWKEGIQLMKEGGKWRFFIPPNLAYGDKAIGKKIPANATLIFEIELISID